MINRFKQNQSICGRTSKLSTMLSTGLLLVFFLNVQFSTAADDQDYRFAVTFLQYYGYLDHSYNHTGFSPDSPFSKGLTDFQNFYGLTPTGQLDTETLKLMKATRCGVKDKLNPAVKSRYMDPKRLRWGNKSITYRIRNYPIQILQFPYPDKPLYAVPLPDHKVDKLIREAFNVWSNVTDLIFIEIKERVRGLELVDIPISFASKYHYCQIEFSGKGSSFAHAFAPGFMGTGGQVHFDNAEFWTYNSTHGIDFFRAAVHEFGHSLGLGHSNIPDAIMYPYINNTSTFSQLHTDDIVGIQSLYGLKTRISNSERENAVTPSPDKETTTTEIPFVIHDIPDLCESGDIDAIFSKPNEGIFVFKGDWYWKFARPNETVEGYPELIVETWPDLKPNIDTAFIFDRNNKTYFFKGSQCWRYTGNKLDSGYPKPISEEFKGIPNNIDAALAPSGTGKVYFFKGSKYWRYDAEAKPPVASTYPKPISQWENIPDNLDASFEYDKKYTYFFRKGLYWKFGGSSLKVDGIVGELPYPRSVSPWWFGCSFAPVRQRPLEPPYPGLVIEKPSDWDGSSAPAIQQTSGRSLGMEAARWPPSQING